MTGNSFVRRYFLPCHCALCGRILGDVPLPLCEECRRRIERERRAHEPGKEQKIAIPFVYQGGARQAVLAFKYQRAKGLADYFAQEISALVSERYDLLVPVPMTRYRRWQRGGNAVEQLAEILSQKLETSIDKTCIIKKKGRKAQHRLPRDKRLSYAQGSFLSSASLEGKRILLVDDICTTGATLRACTQLLKRQGAKEVAWAAIAWTPREKEYSSR